jgi:MFS transporter, DHA2 family, multidrug resistance protein
MNVRIVLIVLTAAIASLLEIIDSSIVNVAIPTMMGNIGATLDEISWVTTGYMIANSIVLPIAAWLGTRLGRRNYFTGAILMFTAASFACGMAPNLPTLIFFRILQGIAGGALLPTSQTLIQESFPPEKRGIAMAIFGMSVMVGPALGPTLGGYLTDNFGWRSIFNINVPLGLIAGFLSWSNVRDVSYEGKKQAGGVDWTGLILLCIGVGCFQYILERGETDGWFDSATIKTCAFFAVTGLASFIYWELKIPNPIMNLRLFKQNVLRSGTLLMLALGVMLYALTFAVPVFVSRIMPQMTATQTGMLFMPGSIVTAVFMMPVGILSGKINPKWLVLIGISLGVSSVLSMAQFTQDTSTTMILIPLILRGVSAAFLFIPINQMVLGEFSGAELGQVSGMQNFFRQIGGSIGIASLDTLITRFSAQHFNDMLSNVNALNASAYNSYMAMAGGGASKLSGNVGLWDSSQLAVKSLMGRVGQQVFILSFEQLCYVIAIVVGAALIPLYLIKPTPRKPGAKVVIDAH